MKTASRSPKLVIEWHAGSRSLPGGVMSGDMYLVQSFNGGVLLAVVDGVGHGNKAAAAARTAIEVLKRHAKESVISLVQRCHEALQGTRGVVMTIASLQAAEGLLTWIGVGNVESRLVQASADQRHPYEEVLLLRGGLVGYRLPALQASMLMVQPGDLLIFATDGVYPGFDALAPLGSSPRMIAERILNDYYKGSDDAVVLVVRYVGKQSLRSRPSSRAARELNRRKNRKS